MDVKEHIRQYIVDGVLFGQDDTFLEYDTMLLGTGILDSMSVLQILSHLEEAFNIQFENYEIVPENFNSINSLADFVDRKLA